MRNVILYLQGIISHTCQNHDGENTQIDAEDGILVEKLTKMLINCSYRFANCKTDNNAILTKTLSGYLELFPEHS